MVYLDFRGLIWNLEQMGMLDVILPFILIFTLIFAVLQKSKILGTYGEDNKPRKNYNIVVALVMALGVVIPHVTGQFPYGRSPVDIINSALPQVSIVVVAIVMFLLLIGVFGKKIDLEQDGGIAGFVTLLSVGIVLLIFAIAAGWLDRGLPRWLDFLRDPQLQALVVVIIVFGLLIAFITKEEKPKKEENDRFATRFKRILKDS